MAFGGTINLFDIGVRDFIEADMTIFTFQFAMNGSGKLFIVDVKNPFGPVFIISSDAGISMAQQAVFRVGNGICSIGHSKSQQPKKECINSNVKGFYMVRFQSGFPLFFSLIAGGSRIPLRAPVCLEYRTECSFLSYQ